MWVFKNNQDIYLVQINGQELATVDVVLGNKLFYNIRPATRVRLEEMPSTKTLLRLWQAWFYATGWSMIALEELDGLERYRERNKHVRIKTLGLERDKVKKYLKIPADLAYPIAMLMQTQEVNRQIRRVRRWCHPLELPTRVLPRAWTAFWNSVAVIIETDAPTVRTFQEQGWAAEILNAEAVDNRPVRVGQVLNLRQLADEMAAYRPMFLANPGPPPLPINYEPSDAGRKALDYMVENIALSTGISKRLTSKLLGRA